MEPDHTVHHTLDMQLNIFSINRFSIAHAKKKHSTIFAYLHLHTEIKMFITFLWLLEQIYFAAFGINT